MTKSGFVKMDPYHNDNEDMDFSRAAGRLNKREKTDESAARRESIWRRELAQKRAKPVSKSDTDISYSAFQLPNPRFSMEYWAIGWVLKEIRDMDWANFTRDAEEQFPRTFRKEEGHVGHPAYVLEEIGSEAIVICPLTGCRQPGGEFIEPTDLLAPAGRRLDKRSWLARRSISRLARDNGLFYNFPILVGIFPPDRLHREEF